MGMKLVATALLAALLCTTVSVEAAEAIEVIDTDGPVNIYASITPTPPVDLRDVDVAALERRPVIRTHYVTLDARGIARAFNPTIATPYQVSIRFTDSAVFAIVVAAIEPVRDGVIRVSGHVRSDDLSRLSLVITDQHLLGTLNTATETIEFMRIQDGVSVVVEVEHRRYPEERRPGAAHKQPEFESFPHPEALEIIPTGGAIELPEPFDGVPYADTDYEASEITVLAVASDDEFACDAEWLEDMEDAYTANLDEVFDSYATSNVVFRCVDVPEDWHDLEEARKHIMNDGDMIDMRQAADADIVVMLLADGLGYCGYSMAPEYPGYPINATWTPFYAAHGAFAVVADECALGNFSFAHEIGHLLGMKHERFSEKGGVSNFCGYGYPVMLGCKPVARTIMAYDGFCTFINGVTCKRAPWFSIPKQSSGSSLSAFSGGGLVKGMSCVSTDSDHLGAPANNTNQLVDTADDVAGYSEHIDAL